MGGSPDNSANINIFIVSYSQTLSLFKNNNMTSGDAGEESEKCCGSNMANTENVRASTHYGSSTICFKI